MQERHSETIILKAIQPHWMDFPDNTKILSVEGLIEFSIGELEIVSPKDGEWRVSAAALYLLRTLTQSHTSDSPVTSDECIIPCCGEMYGNEGGEYCLIVGCGIGIDFDVIHEDGKVLITGVWRNFEAGAALPPLPKRNGRTARTTLKAWRDAVCAFADQISDLYRRSSPKEPFEEEQRIGFECFQREWARLRKQAETLV